VETGYPPGLRRVITLLEFALMLAAVCGGQSVWIGSAALSPDRLFVIAVALPALLAYPVVRLLVPSLVSRVSLADCLYVAWFLSLSISYSLAIHSDLQRNALIYSSLPVACYLLFSWYPPDLGYFIRLSTGLAAVVGVAALGAVALRSFAPGDYLAGLFTEDRLKLLSLEPNIFGSTAAVLFFISLPSSARTRFWPVWTAVCLGSVVLSLSKGPYLGLIAGLLVYGAIEQWERRRIFWQTTLCAAIVGPLILAFSWDGILHYYDNFLSRDDALFSRTLTLSFALQRIWLHPVWGNGPLDFGLSEQSLLLPLGSTDIHDVWIWQMFVSILHDSGMIGLTIYAAFLLVLVKGAFRTSLVGAGHAGILAGFISLLVASQTTTVHLTPLFGMAAGLLSAATKAGRSLEAASNGASRRTSR
jgi:hypothetical protein